MIRTTKILSRVASRAALLAAVFLSACGGTSIDTGEPAAEEATGSTQQALSAGLLVQQLVADWNGVVRHNQRDDGVWGTYAAVPDAPSADSVDVEYNPNTGDMHAVIARGNGKMLHRIRDIFGNWTGTWGDVMAAAQAPADLRIRHVRLAWANGGLHVCATTITSNQLWYTFRRPDGTWQPIFNTAVLWPFIGGVFSAECVGVGNTLHLFMLSQGSGNLWQATRDGNNFFSGASWNTTNAFDIAAANVNGQIHQIVQEGTGVSRRSRTWHRVGLAGSWQNIGWDAYDRTLFQPLMSATNLQGELVVAAAGLNQYKIRRTNGTWTSTQQVPGTSSLPLNPNDGRSRIVGTGLAGIFVGL